MNPQPFDLLSCEKELKIIPNAHHLFEEPGGLEKIVEFVAHWILKYLPKTY